MNQVPVEPEPNASCPRFSALFQRRKSAIIALVAMAAISAHLILRFGFKASWFLDQIPLLAALAFGGFPLVYELTQKIFRRQFGSDLLAGFSIVTSVLLGEYLAGTIVVLMLSGGETLESYALGNAASALRALAKRIPSVAHRRQGSVVVDVATGDIKVGDTLLVYPHDICPVDGSVIEGFGVMNESFLTGEPFAIDKAPGSAVLSGAINGEVALTIIATHPAVDSRYAKIMKVMRESEQNQSRLRRLGDQLGALYTPLAVGIAVLAWVLSGEAVRFLSVLVIATPCPLLIAIPVAVIGSISLAARHAIIIKNPAALEQVSLCRTAIFDKTGTLTYGRPKLTEQLVAPGFSSKEVLALAASLEVYSKHPLARAVLDCAKRENLKFAMVSSISETSGQGLRGTISDHQVQIMSRSQIVRQKVSGAEHLPPEIGGLECLVVIDGRFAAVFRFRDAPRADGNSFIQHLGPKHHFQRVMIVSGDRESEVRYLAEQVGVREIYADQSPEQKLSIVERETKQSKTLFVGDGINDAPAMVAATIGIALGQNSDVTTEAADVVILENSLEKIDEFMHISRRMRSIALQSAVVGMLLSLLGMMFAATGKLGPVPGAILQEVIDVLAVANALRAALPPKTISDIPLFEPTTLSPTGR